MHDVQKCIREVFRLDALSPAQEAAVDAALNGEDVVVLLPTGSGKSLCFQLPAVVEGGVSVVISPLVALVCAQVKDLRGVGVKASTYIGIDSEEHRRTCLRDGTLQILYTTPEQFSNSEALCQWLVLQSEQKRLKRVVFDEAHCICTWGAEFRPCYRKVGSLRDHLPGVPFMALTATATPEMTQDIIATMKSQLNQRGVTVVQIPVFRSNLHLSVVGKRGGGATVDQLIRTLQPRVAEEESGIVYVRTRENADRLAVALARHGIPAKPFHAGHEASHKSHVLDWWTSGALCVVVATVAFGMGIHRPDVRFVLHWCIPSSILCYFQEIGRAGRDNLHSDCILFYSEDDVKACARCHVQKMC